MLKIDTILYPTDFSAGADAAFPHALHLARRLDAVVHMLHVAPVFGEDPIRGAFEAMVDEEAFYGRLREEAEARMQGIIQTYEADDVRIERVHRRGMAPGAEVLEYAASANVDLIVMGTHGRRGIRRMVMGSVAEEVMRHATSPVLAVRVSEEDDVVTLGVRRILVPLDFSSFSDETLRYARALAVEYGADLDVVHVLDSATHPELYTVPLVERGQRLTQLETAAKSELERLREKHVGSAVEVSTHVLVGYAPEEIIDFASAHAVDLIVISSHGRSGLDRFLLGSVTERVLRGAPCPVFVSKPFGKSLLLSAREAGAEAAGTEARRAVNERRT